MLSTFRHIRGWLAVAGVLTAMLIAPSIASATPNFSLGVATSSPTFTSGDTVAYDVTITNAGNASASTLGTVTFDNGYGGAPVIVGTPVVTNVSGPDQTSLIGVAAGSRTVSIANGFTTGAVKVTFAVKLPSYYTSFSGYVSGYIGSSYKYAGEPTSHTVSKGAVTTLTAQFADDASRMAIRGGNYVANVVVKNTGSATAELASLNVGFSANANEFSPTFAPNPAFAPELAYTGGCSAVDTVACMIGSIAPGESKVIQITVSKLTHFGRLNLNAYASYAGGYNYQTGYNSYRVQVTNGKTALVQVDADAPIAAAGRADVLVKGEISNAGPDALESGVLHISTTRLNDAGDYVWNSTSTQKEVESIRSLKLSNGTVCSPWTNPVDHKVAMNHFACPITNLIGGSRLTFELLVNFPTGKPDFDVDVIGNLVTTNFTPSGSSLEFGSSMHLNQSKTVDLETTLSSRALIGGARIAPITVTVTNKGNYRAENVSVGGDARGGVGGTFDLDTFPTRCTGVSKPVYSHCALGTIEPGKSASYVINARAAAKAGLFVVRFGASHDSNGADVFDINTDNNVASTTFRVVKSSAVPFLGVKELRPAAQTLPQLIARGVKTTLTCPSSCRATVSLQVDRKVAVRLGLSKPVRSGHRAKALPYIVVGTATKTRTGAGKLVVTTKLSRAFKLKIAKLRVPLSLNRVTMVKATDRSIADATYTHSQSMTLRPRKHH